MLFIICLTSIVKFTQIVLLKLYFHSATFYAKVILYLDIRNKCELFIFQIR